MRLHTIKPQNLNKKSKRLARGISGKGGHTAGRGNKGQKSRTGYNIPQGFEGGQSKLSIRTPKIGGFKTRKIENIIIKSSKINKNFNDNDIINPETLIKKNIIKNPIKKNQKIKILFDEKFKSKFTIKDILLSKKLVVK